jgi:peptidoglycan L-alanyl-D-glutamate endopeptidase CwlK
MDPKSEAYLVHVHPDLARVMRAAAQNTPFEICYGVRTPEAEAAAVASGHSQTLHSRHLASKTPAYAGLSCAVDVAHLTPATRVIDWAPGHEQMVFSAIATNVIFAAKQLGIPVEWGGSWAENTEVQAGHFHDFGHFQLPWSVYP